jgi:hypothetical protein
MVEVISALRPRVTVIALRAATQFVENNPFPRWWGYLSLWITLMLEAGAFAFVPRTGPLACARWCRRLVVRVAHRRSLRRGGPA